MFLPMSDPQSSQPYSQGDRRSEARLLGKPVQVHVQAGGSVVVGWVMDLSEDGVRLQVPTEIAPGTDLAVRPVNAPEGARWLEAQVRHTRRLGSDHWALGCIFDQVLHPTILPLFTAG